MINPLGFAANQVVQHFNNPIAQGIRNAGTGLVLPAVVGAGEVFNRDLASPVAAFARMAGKASAGKPVGNYAQNYNQAANDLTQGFAQGNQLLDRTGTNTVQQANAAYADPKGTAVNTALATVLPELKALGVAGKVVETGVGGYFGANAIKQLPAELKNIQNLKGDARTKAITEAVLNTGLGVAGTAAALHGGVGLVNDGVSAYKASPILNNERGSIPIDPTAKPDLGAQIQAHYTPSQNSPQEAAAMQHIMSDPQKALDTYKQRLQTEGLAPNVVSGDVAKHVIPGMSSENSAHFHEPASALAKTYYDQLLADPSTADKPVQIMAGGSGAGKTVTLKALGKDAGGNAAVVDTNLNGLKSAIDKIDAARATGRPVNIDYVYRHPIDAFKSVIQRGTTEGRVVPISGHLDNHLGSREVIPQLEAHYANDPQVQVHAYTNLGKSAAEAKAVPIDKLPEIGYNKSELQNKLEGIANEAKQNNTITPEAHATYLGQNSPTGDVGSPTQINQVRAQSLNRGLIESVRTSPEVSPAVAKSVSGEYLPGTNAEKLASSEALLKGGLNKATNKVLGDLSQSAGRVTPQQVSDAIAVAKAHDAAGNFDQATNIYNRLAEHGTVAGQKVQALSLLSNRTPEGLHYAATKVLKNAGVDLTGKLGDQVKAAIDEVKATEPNTDARGLATQKLVKLVNNNIPRGKISAGVGLWRAGLLTGPETFAKVASSYVINTPLEGISKPISAAVDRGVSSIKPIQDFLNRNNKGYASGERTITSNPLADTISGVKGAVRGAQAIPTKLKTGLDLPNTGGFEQALGNGTHLTPYESAVMNAHGAIPKIGYSVIHDATLAEQARTVATNEGLTGSAKTARIAELTKNPIEAMNAVAKQDADYVSNMNDTVLGKAAQSIQGLTVHTKFGDVPIGKILVPFSRVPSSIAAKGIVDYTPLGLGKAGAELFNGLSKGTFDQRAFSQAVGRSVAGSATAVLAGAALMKSGNMTLAAPNDPKERALWDAEGKQPNSIKLGGKWISLNAFGPAGIAIGYGGAYARGGITQAVASAGKLTADQPYFKGIEGMANALNDPTRYASTFTNSTVGSTIPAAVQQTARGTDTTSRAYPKTIQDTLKGDVPGLRQSLPAQEDIFGKALPGANPSGSIAGGVLGTINPYYPSTPRNQTDPTTQELQRLYDALGSSNAPHFATPTTGAIKTIGVNPFLESSGPLVQTGVSNLLQNPAYQALDDQAKSDVINKVIDAARENVPTGKNTKLSAAAQQATSPDFGKTLITGVDKTGKTTTSLTGTSTTNPQGTYQNALSAGLLTPIQDYQAQQNLTRQAITSQFPSDVVSYYNLSATGKQAFANTNPAAAQSLATQAKALNTALGGKASKLNVGKVAKAKKLSIPKMPKIAALKTPKLKAPKVVTFKAPKLAKAKTVKFPAIKQTKVA